MEVIILYSLILKVTSHQLCHILLVTSKSQVPPIRGKGIAQECEQYLSVCLSYQNIDLNSIHPVSVRLVCRSEIFSQWENSFWGGGGWPCKENPDLDLVYSRVQKKCIKLGAFQLTSQITTVSSQQQDKLFYSSLYPQNSQLGGQLIIGAMLNDELFLKTYYFHVVGNHIVYQFRAWTLDPPKCPGITSFSLLFTCHVTLSKLHKFSKPQFSSCVKWA